MCGQDADEETRLLREIDGRVMVVVVVVDRE